MTCSENQIIFQSYWNTECTSSEIGMMLNDAILALRLLYEIHHEFNQLLTAAYLDLKAAFNSVTRASLWKALWGISVPNILLRLIQDLHNDSGAPVHWGTHRSDSFRTRFRVKQGCVRPTAPWTHLHKYQYNCGFNLFYQPGLCRWCCRLCSGQSDLKNAQKWASGTRQLLLG